MPITGPNQVGNRPNQEAFSQMSHAEADPMNFGNSEENAEFHVEQGPKNVYASSPGITGAQFSPTADSYSVSRNKYEDEIPEGSNEQPNYGGPQYAAKQSPGTHDFNG